MNTLPVINNNIKENSNKEISLLEISYNQYVINKGVDVDNLHSFKDVVIYCVLPYLKSVDDKWYNFINEQLDKNIIDKISEKIYEDSLKTQIYPSLNNILAAFLVIPFSKIKVLLIGQDPYHTPNVATGLAFGHNPVDNPKNIQASLKNIYNELEYDGYKCKKRNGDLRGWAKEGVLLLNTALTVRKGEAGSHTKEKVWKSFIENTFKFLNDECEHLVVLMWGKPAQSFEKIFNKEKHVCIKSGHPSPINTSGGFLGSNPFSKTNYILEKWGIGKINWNL